ncbi:RNA-binding protein 7 [Onthophagus taurus]|uniref:RNA-binding protein 7 n=1 Tax=Onthophagus taurus TaxID=166361 RepID=UPI000C209A82|nr:RNA-binding protein 7 [Onthophagus taurus]
MENEDQRTIFCGNLSTRVTEELLYELFLQVAPLEKVKIPVDRDGRPGSYGFVTCRHVQSVPYAIRLLNGTALFDRRLNLKPRTPQNSQQQNHPTVPSQVKTPQRNLQEMVLTGQFLVSNSSKHSYGEYSPVARRQYDRKDHRRGHRYDHHENRHGNYGNQGSYNRRRLRMNN